MEKKFLTKLKYIWVKNKRNNIPILFGLVACQKMFSKSEVLNEGKKWNLLYLCQRG